MAKIEMTAEMAERMRGLLPIIGDAKYTFTPEIYKHEKFPAEFAPKFTVRRMSVVEKSEYFVGGNAEKRSEVIRKCVISVDNLWDIEKREELSVDCKDGMPEDVFDALRFDVQQEIGTQILKSTGLVDVEYLGLK